MFCGPAMDKTEVLWYTDGVKTSRASREAIPPESEADFMKVQYVGRLYTSTYRVEVHSHDLWELVYYTDGQGVVRIGEEKIPFAPGDIFLLPLRWSIPTIPTRASAITITSFPTSPWAPGTI